MNRYHTSLAFYWLNFKCYKNIGLIASILHWSRAHMYRKKMFRIAINKLFEFLECSPPTVEARGSIPGRDMSVLRPIPTSCQWTHPPDARGEGSGVRSFMLLFFPFQKPDLGPGHFWEEDLRIFQPTSRSFQPTSRAFQPTVLPGHSNLYSK